MRPYLVSITSCNVPCVVHFTSYHLRYGQFLHVHLTRQYTAYIFFHIWFLAGSNLVQLCMFYGQCFLHLSFPVLLHEQYRASLPYIIVCVEIKLYFHYTKKSFCHFTASILLVGHHLSYSMLPPAQVFATHYSTH